jgi:hypothetical protein
MNHITSKKRGLALIAVLLISTAGAQSAEAAATVRIRGVVESLQSDTLMVKSRDGKDVTVKLKAGWTATGVVKASIADIKPGDFVGIASEPTDSGVNGALEVHIFPASMKGTGEGDRAWDGKPKSSMTNATVTSAVTSVNGPTLTLTYRGGERKISIPEGTPIVRFSSATKDDVKAGAGVIITATPAADNSVESDRVIVGLNGVVPPM